MNTDFLKGYPHPSCFRKFEPNSEEMSFFENGWRFCEVPDVAGEENNQCYCFRFYLRFCKLIENEFKQFMTEKVNVKSGGIAYTIVVSFWFATIPVKI